MVKFVHNIAWESMLTRSIQFLYAHCLSVQFIEQKRQKIELSQIRKALVVRLDGIGDMVMMTPFLRELRCNLGKAWITLVVKAQVYNLVEICPYVNEVLIYGSHTHKPLPLIKRHWSSFRFARKHLRGHKFDLGIHPRWDVDSDCCACLIYFSQAGARLGYSEKVNAQKRRFNKGLDRFLTHVIEDNNLKHEVEHNLDIIRFLGGEVQSDKLETWLSPEDKRFADQVLIFHKIQPHDLLIAFSPGAAHPKRIWPLSRFVELGRWLKSEYKAAIVVVGGPGEESLGQMLQQRIDGTVVNLVGNSTLRQTAAILKTCHLFVGSDSGPMHLAAAAGVPVVEISAQAFKGSPFMINSPKRFGPWGVSHRILQPEKAIPPCTDTCVSEEAHCICSVTVDQVKKAVTGLLSDQGYRMLDKKYLSNHMKSA